MNNNNHEHRTDILILVGGLGTRIKDVNSKIPKVMLPVAGKPFLAHLINYVKSQNYFSIILCVGYKAKKIIAYFNDGKDYGVEIKYSVEKEPLGTGGAVIKALEKVSSEQFVMLNGDSFFGVNLEKLTSFHYKNNSDCTLSLHKCVDAYRYGSVILDTNNKVKLFTEKSLSHGDTPSLINGGVYFFNRRIFSGFAKGIKLSLEYEIFPSIINTYKFLGYISDGNFIDIGVPADYNKLLLNSELINYTKYKGDKCRI